MKIGLFGAGRIGSLHLETLVHNPDVGAVRVFDIDAERARALAARHDVAVATDVASLMKWSDAVVIATSTDTHAQLLTAAAKAQTPAFCEKPIAIDLVSTDEAIAAIGAAGVPVQIGFNRRFDAGFRAARQAVQSGALGTLLMVVGHHHDHQPPSPEYISASGGQFKDQLIHDFDLLRFVTLDEVVEVHATGTSADLPVFGENGDHAVAHVNLWMASGALAVLVGVRMDPVGYDVRMEIFGTDDSVAAGLGERTPIRSVEPGLRPPAEPYREIFGRFGSSYRAEIDTFLLVASGKEQSPCTPGDARAALLVAEAASMSAREKRTVRITDVE